MQRIGNHRKQLSIESEAVLLAHDWPGNVRELEHLIARLVIFGAPDTEVITVAEVEKHIKTSHQQPSDVLNQPIDASFELDRLVRNVQWHYVRRAAQLADGNKTEIARLLGYGASR